MKRAISILIVIFYLSGIFSPFYAFAGYVLHKKYIAENLCVNQSKPEMDCEGKCYLNQQIIQDVTKTSETKSGLPSDNNINFYTPHYTTDGFKITLITEIVYLDNYFTDQLINSGHLLTVYSPPEV